MTLMSAYLIKKKHALMPTLILSTHVQMHDFLVQSGHKAVAPIFQKQK